MADRPGMSAVVGTRISTPGTLAKSSWREFPATIQRRLVTAMLRSPVGAPRAAPPGHRASDPQGILCCSGDL